jgi:tetratricopeptide (TPR) repeat protein
VAALVVFGVAQVLTDPASIDLDAGQGVVVVLPYHDPISTPEEKALLVELAGELTRQLNRWESMRAVPVVALPGAMFDLGVEGPTLGRVDEGLEVASRLGVETLVTLNGRLRRDSLTLTASLFDVSSGRELGRPLESSGAAADLFPLAATIVHAMLGLEGPVAEVEELRRQSSHPGALQDYARGIQLLERWRLEDAEASLRSATALDTAFAMAHHYLALTLHLRSSEVVERQSILGPEAGRSAIAALRHSVGLPTRDSLHVLAFHRFQEGDYEEARSIYRDLIGGDSTDVYAWLLGGIVEFTDPWLDENPDGFLAPRADWNTVVRAFSETVRLSPGFHLGYGYLLDITWQGRRDDLLIGAPLALPEGRLRTGIHFGLVARRRDGDLFGDAVNVASRLGGIAEPGQIVLSQTAGDQLGDEIELDDLGERTLKNVPDVRCWAIPINTPSTKLGTHPHQTQSQESGDR